MDNYYVYIHKKKTTGEVFYVGKGKEKRAWAINGRNKYWKNIVSKHGFTVEIYATDLQEWYALELEKELILKYGRLVDKSGSLCNITIGGESCGGESNGRCDYTIWTFYHIPTQQIVKTSRIMFRKNYKNVHVNCLFSEKSRVQHSKGWVVLEKVSEGYIKAFEEGFRDEYSPHADKTVYTFVNIDTLESFIGNKWEMLSKYPHVNVNMLVHKVKRTSKRWTLKETLDSFHLEKLRNPFSGIHGHKADKREYEFVNLISGEVFKGTRCAFKEYTDLNISYLFTKNPKLTSGDWCLKENIELAKNIARNDYTKYSFVHKNGEEFNGTKTQFKSYTGICPSPLFLTVPRKTCKGWRLAEPINP